MARRFTLYRFPLILPLLGLAVAALHPASARAQEKPYFVTYSHDLEEPGNLEIESKSAFARPDGGNRFAGAANELEYGVRAWWTSELYLDGQTTARESTIPTGFRLENRVRPLMREHIVNPVLYVEYENISGADKALIEVVGHDDQSGLAAANAQSRRVHQHEGELKLILSSNTGAWNISENFIAEKDFSHAPWEFGYAAGAARPLRAAFGSRECTLCAEKLTLGAEAYGGLGDTWSLTTRDTSHYIAPIAGWELPHGGRLSFSPGWGLTGSSLHRIYRVGLAYELPQIGGWFRGHAGGAQ